METIFIWSHKCVYPPLIHRHSFTRTRQTLWTSATLWCGAIRNDVVVVVGIGRVSEYFLFSYLMCVRVHLICAGIILNKQQQNEANIRMNTSIYWSNSVFCFEILKKYVFPFVPDDRQKNGIEKWTACGRGSYLINICSKGQMDYTLVEVQTCVAYEEHLVHSMGQSIPFSYIHSVSNVAT